mmetsp:Transcript_28288/g.76640  ORF Transcript_28288/g.76640 Transcript_28288/m.76640 type:complete len:169 (+) Transcript_28288:3-509(+)
MMARDNTMRYLNKIHMALPLLVIGIPLGALCLAPLMYPMEFSPYVFHIVTRCLYHTNEVIQSRVCWVVMAIALVAIFSSRSSIFETTNSKNTIKCAERLSANAIVADTDSIKATSHLVPILVRASGLRTIALHIAWVGLCYYFEANSSMANGILLAPWQQPIYLDDIK